MSRGLWTISTMLTHFIIRGWPGSSRSRSSGPPRSEEDASAKTTGSGSMENPTDGRLWLGPGPLAHLGRLSWANDGCLAWQSPRLAMTMT